jgi:hypothetical protein
VADPAERETLSRRLGNDARLRLDVTEGERSALRRYQARDRTYELINRLLRFEVDPESFDLAQLEMVDETVSALDALARRWQTPEALRVYRGLRRRDIDVLGRGVQPARSFLSTTLDRDIALAEFTVPPGASGPALMEIEVPAGTPAIWVPPVGDPILAYQQELILDRRVRVRTGERREEGDTLVVDCEVLL